MHQTDHLPSASLYFVQLRIAARRCPVSSSTISTLSKPINCFTIAELIEYEAMGLTARARAPCLLEGWTERMGGCRQPVGRAQIKGHPIGATGVSSACAGGDAGDRAGGRHPGAGRGARGVMNMGGVAVANFVSILEPLRA